MNVVNESRYRPGEAIDVNRITAVIGAWMIALALIVTGSTGCRPTSTAGSGSTDAVDPADSQARDVVPIEQRGDAKIRLRDVFRRYQVCSYYHDDGRVTLTSDGETSTTAPMRVRFNRREMNVDAYAARVRVDVDPNRVGAGVPDQDRVELTAWFDEVESSNFDSQVLRSGWESPMNQRLSLDRILQDEVLRSRLSAGLAGPPPQLEWLLADEPMSRLFQIDEPSRDRFEWLEDARLEKEITHRIVVTSDRDRFVFWIDPATSLIRRVELPPPPTIGEEFGSDSDWSLTLDLVDATFQPADDSVPEFSMAPSFKPIEVRQLIPIPPPPPSSLVGRRIDIRLRSSDSNADRFRVIAIMPTMAGDRRRWTQTWAGVIPLLAGATELFLIAPDSRSAETLTEFPSPPVSVRLQNDVKATMRTLRLDSGSLAVVDANDRVLLIEPSTDAGSIGNVVAVIRDSLSGVDVPRRIADDYKELIRGYRSRLDAVRLP